MSYDNFFFPDDSLYFSIFCFGISIQSLISFSTFFFFFCVKELFFLAEEMSLQFGKILPLPFACLFGYIEVALKKVTNHFPASNPVFIKLCKFAFCCC